MTSGRWDATHLAVQVEEIKRKQADADLDVLDLDVLALPPAELLEGKQLRRVLVDGHRLGVEHERLRALFDALWGAAVSPRGLSDRAQARGAPWRKLTHPGQLLHQVRILFAHVLGVAAEDRDGTIRKLVDLERIMRD